MENFVAHNPTELHFGKDVVNNLANTVLKYGKKVLLIYGKGSIKKNGIYDKVLDQLNAIQAEIFEYSGIKPNPIVENVDEAADLGIKNEIDVIVAVGGGSVVDSSKIISLCIAGNYKAWDVMKYAVNPVKAVPLVCILTLAATGTEMNGNAVVQNHATDEKIGYHHILCYPAHSFLDPEFTYSVPPDQTTNGIVDAMAHCFEAWFGYGKASLSDRFVISILKELIYWGPKLLREPQNYDCRANVMWAATCALNDMTMHARAGGDWGVHSLGHILSLLFDTAHGATLSIVFPAWLKLHKDRCPERIIQLGNELFRTRTVDYTIDRFEKFFASINSPIRLKHIGVKKDKKELVVNIMKKNKASGGHYIIQDVDYEKLFDLMA